MLHTFKIARILAGSRGAPHGTSNSELSFRLRTSLDLIKDRIHAIQVSLRFPQRRDHEIDVVEEHQAVFQLLRAHGVQLVERARNGSVWKLLHIPYILR